MPYRPLSICLHPGCGTLVESGRCPAHQRERNVERGSASRRGYSTDWRRLRIKCLVRDGWKCAVCGWEPDLIHLAREFGVTPPHASAVLEELRMRKNSGQQHLHGDHEAPIAESPERRLDAANIQILCDRCHTAKTFGGK
jgi:5-methylcytosine-specific restriction endonuclease McrA